MTEARFAFHHYPTLDSTNEEAKRLLNSGELSRLTVLMADSQTAGKGTQGRQWFSPPGAGLYFSIVHAFDLDEKHGAFWHPEHLALGTDNNFTSVVENFDFSEVKKVAQQTFSEVPLTPLFTLAAGVACAETLATLTGLAIQLKPINDLYVDGRKLGGILTESLISENRCKALITGIGINIREHEDIQAGCVRENRGHQPISLQSCIPQQIFSQWHPDALRRELCEAIALAVDAQYRRLAQGEAASLLASYLQYKLPDVELPEGVARVLASL